MLYVRFDGAHDGDHDLYIPPSWQVAVDRDDTKTVVLFGFGRKCDAEIAKKFLDTLAVDWNGPRLEAWKQLVDLGYPDREDLMRAAVERLEW